MVTEATLQFIVKAYTNGMTYRDIRRETGHAMNTLVRVLKASGIDFTKRNALVKSRGRRVYSLNERYFKEIDTERKAWLLGFIAADGSVGISKGSTHTLSIQLAWKDREILEIIRTELGYGGPIHRIEMRPGQKTHIMALLRIASVQMVYDLFAAGIHQRKSLTIKPWAGPTQLMRHYWRGVFDGDGWFSSNGKDWKFGLCGSRFMVDGFTAYCCEIIQSKAKPRRQSKCKSWEVEFAGNGNVPHIAAHFFTDCTISLRRKLLLARFIIDGHSTYEPRNRVSL